jgi:hypothetical protein
MMLLNVFHRKWSGLDDQPSQDKENIPPSFGSQKPAIKQGVIILTCTKNNHNQCLIVWTLDCKFFLNMS